MNREQKIQLLNDIQTGKVNANSLRVPINEKQLTSNELYLILSILSDGNGGMREINKEESECLEYYRVLSQQRDETADLNYEGADAKVREWYQVLNIQSLFEIKDHE